MIIQTKRLKYDHVYLGMPKIYLQQLYENPRHENLIEQGFIQYK